MLGFLQGVSRFGILGRHQSRAVECVRTYLLSSFKVFISYLNLRRFRVGRFGVVLIGIGTRPGQPPRSRNQKLEPQSPKAFDPKP